MSEEGIVPFPDLLGCLFPLSYKPNPRQNTYEVTSGAEKPRNLCLDILREERYRRIDNPPLERLARKWR